MAEIGEEEVSLTFEATIVKAEAPMIGPCRVFGFCSISQTADGKPVVDRQNDVIEPPDLEEAAYEFVLHFRDTGEMHRGGTVGKLIESVVLTAEKQKAMGIPPGTVPVAWWIGFEISDPAAIAKVRAGDYKAFSIQGKGVRVPASGGA